MKKILAFILLCATLMTANFAVFAEVQEKDTFYLNEQKDIVIAISWDQAKPAIVFIDPEGIEYNPDQSAEGTMTAENTTTKTIYYIVQGAAQGQWRVRYDKGTNSRIDIELHEYKKGLFIENFTLGTIEEKYLPVSFQVSGEDGAYYNYRISAMIDHTGSEKVVASGTARVGDVKNTRANLSALSSYNAYMLKLYVWQNEDGSDLFDFMFSPTFEFVNKAMDKYASDFKMIVCPDESLLYVGFDKLDYNVDGMLVAVFEDGGEEPIFFDEYDRDKEEIQLAYDPAAKEVSVEVSYKVDGVNTTPIRKTAKISDMAISIPSGEAFNSINLPMTYKGLEKQLCAVTVNGYVTELVLDGKGQSNITLGDDWNTLRIEYLDQNGVTWLIEREIFVDRIPPVLHMSQNYDGMAVSAEEVAVSGTTSDCEELLINGKSVKIEANGAFSEKIKLSKGENRVTVIAKDALGNETRYSAVIFSGVITENKGTENTAPGAFLEKIFSQDSYFVLISSSVIALLIVAYALIFWKKQKEKTQGEKKEKKQKKEKKVKPKKGDAEK